MSRADKNKKLSKAVSSQSGNVQDLYVSLGSITS